MAEKTELYFCRCICGDVRDELWIRFPTKPENEFGLGRSQQNDVRLVATNVSRNHASIMKTADEKFAIKDNNSLNGIHLNDARVKAGVWNTLKVGDRVEIGRPDVDEKEILKVDEGDRFLFVVKVASSDELDAKKPGLKIYVATSCRNIYKVKSTKNDNNHDNKPNLKFLPPQQSNELNEDERDGQNRAKIREDEQTSAKIQEDETNSTKIREDRVDENGAKIKNKRCVRQVSEEIEQENKRLKLELEQKEVALQEEIEVRNEKLKEEQSKMAAELESKFKNKLVEKEVELEMRLQLEKDIAIEQCRASIVEEKPCTSLNTVVDAMENELQCSICAQLFIVSTTLNCAHTFCQYCITEWRKVKNICPVCRKQIETMTRSLVLDNYIDTVMESLPDEWKENRKKFVEERKKEVELSVQTLTRGRSRRGRGRVRGSSNRGVNTRARGRGRGRGNVFLPIQTRSSVVIISDDESSESSNSNSSSDSIPMLDLTDSSNYAAMDGSDSNDSYGHGWRW